MKEVRIYCPKSGEIQMCGRPSTHIYIEKLVCLCLALARLQHSVVWP